MDFVEERIRNIIADELLKYVPRGRKIKKGFFAGDYLRNLGVRKESSILITEELVREALKSGSRTLAIPEKSIITPLAREMIDEKNIRLVYERS